jgi:small subunit ribosomal protein S19e
MVTAFDVPGQKLVEYIAEEFKKNELFSPPHWALFVKTGPQAQRPPDNPKWWYYRVASILRKVYIKGPIGTERLRVYYGGRKRGRSRPERTVKCGGKNIRTILQQLEEAKYVKKLGKKGRVVTKEGRSFVDKMATQLYRELYAKGEEK